MRAEGTGAHVPYISSPSPPNGRAPSAACGAAGKVVVVVAAAAEGIQYSRFAKAPMTAGCGVNAMRWHSAWYCEMATADQSQLSMR